MYSNNLLTSGKTHYDPFGMLLVGRNWEGGSEYRFGFNGKEGDDEIAGNANALDFGARVYDTRLGIWMSIDPLTAKFPSWSPYSFAMVSPISNVDFDGNENVIYLVLLPNSSTSLSTSDVTNIINLANSNFQALGVKTRVVLATEFCGSDISAFDPNKIDVTDGIAVLGNAKEVIKFIDSYGPNSMKWDDFGAPNNTSNPETSENKGVGGGGNWIAIDASDIPIITEDIHTESSFEDKKAQFGALLINHGAGHLAGMNHTGSMKVDDQVTIPTDEGFTFSSIMQDGNGLLSDINNPNVGYVSLTSDSPDDPVKMYYYTDPTGKQESKKVISISRNSEYDSYNKERFGDEDSKVNYKK